MKGQKGSRGRGNAAVQQPLLYKNIEQLKNHERQSTTSSPLGALAFIESEDVLVVRCKNQWREIQVGLLLEMSAMQVETEYYR